MGRAVKNAIVFYLSLFAIFIYVATKPKFAGAAYPIFGFVWVISSMGYIFMAANGRINGWKSQILFAASFFILLYSWAVMADFIFDMGSGQEWRQYVRFPAES